MAEQKKVAFSTISSENGSVKRKKSVRTIRLALALPESNEKSCPEFNYRELLSQRISLLRKEKAKKVDGQILNGPLRDPDDPFADDDDQALKALARQLEKKYGGTGKRRKKERNFQTLGEGYDETDPFIDNSEAVDDVVPTNKETKHGGFYINSGELDFDEVPVSEAEEESPDEDSDDNSRVHIKKRKKIISSDEEEGATPTAPEAKKVLSRENGVFLKPKKRKLDEGELLRRRKKLIHKFNAKKDTTSDAPKEESVPKESKGEDEEREEEEQKDSYSKEKAIADSIEAVISMAMEANSTPATPDQDPLSSASPATVNSEEGKLADAPAIHEEDSSSRSSSSSSSSSTSSTGSSSSISESEKEDKENGKDADDNPRTQDASKIDMPENGPDRGSISDQDQEAIPLPSGLSPDLVKVIELLKEAGRTSKGSSQKFFTDSVNRMLLSIEMKLNRMGGRKKTQIYNHLSQHLPCGKQTLVKRGKLLVEENFENSLKSPLEKLKQAVSEAMPTLIDSHARECQKAAERKGEGEHNEEENEEHVKKTKLPKKKFPFTEKIRKLLCEVVQVRCYLYSMIKKRSETGEVQVRSFLESRVKPIWPKGWMTTKVLFKESAGVHHCITGYSPEKKKESSVEHKAALPIVMASGVVEKRHTSSSEKIAKPTTEVIPIENSVTAKVIKDIVTKTPEKLNPVSNFNSKSEIISPETVTSAENVKSKLQNDLAKVPSVSPKHLPQGGGVQAENPAAGLASPSYDSSPASFIGFDSPAKSIEGTPNSTVPEHKLSIPVDLNKKNRPKSPLYDTFMPVREGKRPKPSLTATVLPKVAHVNETPVAKIESPKKSPSCEDKKVINCIQIKTVERINEVAHPGIDKKVEKDRIPVSHDRTVLSQTQASKETSIRSFKPIDSSGAIDLTSDSKKKDSGLVDQKVSLDLSNKGRSNESLTPIESPTSEPKVSHRNEKLEQELDDVMNELLQISKQKSEQKCEPMPNDKIRTSPLKINKSETFGIPCDSLNAKLDSYSLNPQLKSSVSQSHSLKEAETRLAMNPPTKHLQRSHLLSTGSSSIEDNPPRSHHHHPNHPPKADIQIEPVSMNKTAGYHHSSLQSHPNGMNEPPSKLSASIFPVSRSSISSSHRSSSSSQASVHISSVGSQRVSPQKTPPSPHGPPSHNASPIPAHSSQVSIHRVSPKNIPHSYASTNSSHVVSHSPHASSVSIFSTSQGSSSSQNASHHSTQPHISSHSAHALSQSSHAHSEALRGYETSPNAKSQPLNVSHGSRSSNHGLYGNTSQSASSNYPQGSKMNSSPASHHLSSHELLQGYSSHSSSTQGSSRVSYSNRDSSHVSNRGSIPLETSHGLSRSMSHEQPRASHLPYEPSHGSSRSSHSNISPNHTSPRVSSHTIENLHRSSSKAMSAPQKNSSSSHAGASSHGGSYNSSSSYNSSGSGSSHKSVRNTMGSPPLSSKHSEYSSHHQHHSGSPQKVHHQVSAQIPSHHQKIHRSGSSNWSSDSAGMRGPPSTYDATAVSTKTSPSKLQQRSPDNSYSIANLRMMQGIGGNSVPKKPSHSSSHSHSHTSHSSNHGTSSSGSSSHHRSSAAAPSLPSPVSSSKLNQRVDRHSPHSVYENLTKEQIEFLKISQQQQPELWNQMNVNNYLSQLPSTEMYKYMPHSGRMYPPGQTPPSNSSGSSKKY